MSLLLKLNILFYIFLLKSWNLIQAASIYSNFYNSLDMVNKDIKDYWDNYEPNLKRETNEQSNSEEFYPQKCKPISYLTTTELSTATITTTTCKPYSLGSTDPSAAEAQDVIDHIIHILKSMRGHAIALIRNMNELEMNILSSSPPSNLEALCKNSTIALSESMNGMEKIVYPYVLYQTPSNVIGEWSRPIKTDSIPEAMQTNDFVAEAQQAVKSWKEQIEICKHILDNAVHNALQEGNLKSDTIPDSVAIKNLKTEQSYNYPSLSFDNNVNNHLNPSEIDLQDEQEKLNPSSIGFEQLSRDLEAERERLQKTPRKSKKHKFQSLYDAFRIKEGDY